MNAEHVPVLCAQAVEWLAAGRGGLYVDATLGPGGHAEAILEASPTVHLVGIDRDPDARALAARRLARFGSRVEIHAGNFDELARVLAGRRPAGIFADLGVSSLQLDRAARGFSFRAEGPLDMRMASSGTTAADLVNRMTEAELETIFRSYGEERDARRVARAVVATRARKPIETTRELADIVRGAKRRARGEERIDPATRVFQALRIAVNDELESLASMLDAAIELLDRDGRLVVISYHSLEDRIVKNRLRDAARGEVDPITGRTRSETRVLELLTKRPVFPAAEEIARNPRSRSARLRAARRL
ncbi:MAG TPA: 16S rRNA (cytosine(1402)-N(4))-methyltransferase RsmH [Thermoanaerobaculia bacterium]|nr:16S rRNA (cytosine(1402)-N(4))-methyltransferase RsmH [Thermoanaerobaculia bacterium]